MELVLNETQKLKLTVKRGEESFSYEILKPTMSVQKKLQEELEACQKSGLNPLPVMLQWAVGLGLPEDFVMSLQPETFQRFVEEISGAKKS